MGGAMLFLKDILCGEYNPVENDAAVEIFEFHIVAGEAEDNVSY